MVRHGADYARSEFHLVDVAEGLGEEQDPLAVVRPVGPLAEVRDAADVRRQLVDGRLALLVSCKSAGRYRQRKQNAGQRQ
jgi:hypothetical protein